MILTANFFGVKCLLLMMSMSGFSHGSKSAPSLFALSAKLRPRLQGLVIKWFRFHFVAFSNRSTLDCVFRCLRLHHRFHRVRVNMQEVKRRRRCCVFK